MQDEISEKEYGKNFKFMPYTYLLELAKDEQ